MKQFIWTLSAIVLLTLPGGAQLTPGEQAHASAAAHRREARNNPERPRHRRHHKSHHRKHHGA